jgi:UDP-N-acetylmuramyl tripeptide synthase
MTELAYPSGLPSGHGYVRLREIRDCLQPREVLRWRDLAVDGLCFDSKEARSGNLFFAIRGAKNDGSLYAQQAVAKGAVAVVAEEPLALPVPVLVVPSARQALADAARYYYRDPSRAVSVVGVTGTNGKTTTAHLIRACRPIAGSAGCSARLRTSSAAAVSRRATPRPTRCGCRATCARWPTATPARA